jgi:uncharacterized protein YjbI with pentapeptide repeats
MQAQVLKRIENVTPEAFALIKDDHEASIVHTHQTWTGSRILRSTYRQVVFSECVFYSTEFQGVKFENCIFENCNFNFAHLRNCQFINCSFNNCSWQACSSSLSLFKDCQMDQDLMNMTSGSHNEVTTTAQDCTTDIYIENLLAA